MAYGVAMDELDFRRQTTLITGASSGIGAALARELAARGSGLVLVARRLDRLDALAAELRAAHGVDVATATVDLSAPRPGPALRDELRRRGITVTSLVNNAGFGTDGAFRDEHPERLAREIAVNIGAVVDLTSTFLADLCAAGDGVLLNVTSEAAYQPIPGMATYAASKAFVLAFTEALWAELRGSGVRVLAFAPGLTATEFFDEIGTGQYPGRFQTAEEVAARAVRALAGRSPGPSARARRSGAVAGWFSGLLTRRARVLAIARIAGSERLMRAGELRPAGA